MTELSNPGAPAASLAVAANPDPSGTRNRVTLKTGVGHDPTAGSPSASAQVANTTARQSTASTPSEVFGALSRITDEEVSVLRAIFPELRDPGKGALDLRGVSNATWFGNILNERFRRRVQTEIDSGTITGDLKMTRQGQRGIDAWLPGGAGYDLFTASGEGLIAHENKYLNKPSPDGATVIKELYPLIYFR